MRCWTVLLLAACASAPPARRPVQKQGDVVIQKPQTVQTQDLVIQEGNLILQQKAHYTMEGSTLSARKSDPFPRFTVDQFAHLELNRSKIPQFEVTAKGNGRVTLKESSAGVLLVQNKGEVRAVDSQIEELAVRDEGQVSLENCRVGDLTIRLDRVSVEFKNLQSGDFHYAGVTLKNTQVKRWKFIIANSTHATFDKCASLAIVFEVRNEVVTVDDLEPGPVKDRVLSTRTAAITVVLRECVVSEWGLRGAGEAVLGARRSKIGEIVASDRSRVLLMNSETTGRPAIAQNAATVELDRSRAKPGPFYARDRGVIKMIQSVVEDGATFSAWTDSRIECWQMHQPGAVTLHDSAKFAVDGHQIDR